MTGTNTCVVRTLSLSGLRGVLHFSLAGFLHPPGLGIQQRCILCQNEFWCGLSLKFYRIKYIAPSIHYSLVLAV